jgi:hypothetical protein
VTGVQPAVEIQGLPATTAVAGGDDPFYAQVGINNGGTGLSRVENVRGGAPGPLTVTFTSGTAAIGTIVDASGPPGASSKTAQIVPGVYYSPTSVSQGGVAFHPLTIGSSLITVDITGFIRTSTNGNRTIIVQ